MKIIKITEKQYDIFNELVHYVEEEYGQEVFTLNAPIEEISSGKFKIVGYELTIQNSVLFSKFQEELLSNSIYIF